MPVSAVLIMLMGALLFLRLAKTRIAVALLVTTFVLLWVAATPIVAAGLYRQLEADYPAQPLSRLPESECIVLLGGVVGEIFGVGVKIFLPTIFTPTPIIEYLYSDPKNRLNFQPTSYTRSL